MTSLNPALLNKLQKETFTAVAESPGTLSGADLARALLRSEASVNQQLALLHDAGLVDRRVDTLHKNRKVCSLTEHGTAQWALLRAQAAGVV